MSTLNRRVARLEAMIGAQGCTCPRGIAVSLRTLVRGSDPREQLAAFERELARPDACPVHGRIPRIDVRLHGRGSDAAFDDAWRDLHEQMRAGLQ